ncbi:hypothetical protein Dsin_021403 [Dipteronia sinensis]|uniref:Reverse transcriptase domain-containing protein n=1 Tax=Dipteronia sinensis TaxID=43782 RepID=A0AAD9ZZP9_9ROSI|nr:hypothetical protein Dsin_021403 [Dipteronia sinensis]
MAKIQRRGGLMIKLDFEKAYDSLDHVFLDHMLNELGFGWKWCQWIRNFISSPAVSVLVNGSPTRQFGIKRGLREGDPLSPFLFNVAVEGLSALLRKAASMDMLKGIFFSEDSIHISHLQFADNTILFLQPRRDYLMNTRSILRCFELAYGLSLIFHKSCMVKISKGGDGDVNWAAIFRCAKATLPIMYLGLPLEGRPSLKIFWNELIRRIEGGLGLVSVFHKNISLLAKWVWRFSTEEAPLWKKVICSKYSVSTETLRWDWNCRKNSLTFTKAVGNLFKQGSRFARILEEGIQVVVGRGDRARLWTDVLVEGTSLKYAFPRIYTLAEGEEADFIRVWQGLCPQKVEIFFWQLLHGRVTVREVIKKFGMLLDDSEGCPMCEDSKESIDHLFLSYQRWTGKTIIVVSDSQVAVSLINKERWGSRKHAEAIHDIRIYINTGFVSVVYCSRDYNSIVDLMAKNGPRNEGESYFWCD